MSEACIYYTAICVVFILIQAIIKGSFTSDAINCLQFIMFLPFTLFVALGNLLYRHFNSSRPKRYIFHFLCTAAGFLLGIYMPYALLSNPSGSNSFIVITLCLSLYAVALIIHAIVTSKRDKSKKEEAPYVSQFKKK